MAGMSRRQFLKCCTRWGIVLGAVGLKPFSALAEVLGKEAGPQTGLPSSENRAQDRNRVPDLAAVRGKNPSQMVEKALHLLGGIERWVREGDTVVLKPNFSFSRPPAMGATTSPEVVRAVIRLCLRGGAKQVLVVDHPLDNAYSCAHVSGIAGVAGEFGSASLLLGDRESFYRSYPVTRGKELHRVKVLKQAMAAEILINLPTAKSHSATGVSLSLKNLMGLVWDRGYFHTRIDLNQGIADLASLIRPQLTVMDATRALTSGGPGGPGKVEEVKVVIAGVDPVAVDSYTVALVPWYGRKFQGKQLKHILAAHRLGLGEIDLTKLAIAEETIS